ncbi:MmgE/PrpD family protein [Caballeronia sp. LjRoot31]
MAAHAIKRGFMFHPDRRDGASALFAAFASGLEFTQLPPEVVQQAKQSILDVLGLALAGERMNAGCAPVTAYCAAASGPGASTVWSTGQRLAPGYAALANAAHARALDYDDIIEYPQIHVAACVVPAAVAMAQAHRLPGAGRVLLSAVAVGCELQARLAAALAPHFGEGLPIMLASQIFGYFSAAAACGNIIRLSEESMLDALGLALMQAAGTEETVVHAPLSMGKFLYSGLSNQAGVQSAMMASFGIQARADVLTGVAGLFNAYFGGNYAAEALTDGLGRDYRSLTRCFKSMPGTLVAHAFVEAALILLDSAGGDPGAIEKVVLYVGPWGRVMCEPSEMRRHPPGASAAMNSIPFMVAHALVRGRIGIADFGEAGRNDPGVLSMAARFEHIVMPELANRTGLEPGVVNLWLKDGRRLAHRIDAPAGHPSRPLSFDDVAIKFHRNLDDASVPMTPARREEIVQHVRSLESLDNISPIFESVSDDTNSRGSHAS